MRLIPIARIGGAAVSERVPYLYSVLRLVPCNDRGEALNVGLVMFCRPQRFLHVAWDVDSELLRLFAPNLDQAHIASRLETYAAIAAGNERGGPVAGLDMGERFHWLTNISNTMIQPGPVHPGLTSDAPSTFARLFEKLVAVTGREP